MVVYDLVHRQISFISCLNIDQIAYIWYSWLVMANTRELRRRIKSVKNISQITKAMQMVAATKMRKAQVQASSARPYSQTLSFATSEIIAKTNASKHPLLQHNDSSKVALVLLSTDKSLCGALNSNLFRLVSQVLGGKYPFAGENMDSHLRGHDKNNKEEFIFYTVGRKGRSFVVKIGRQLEADFENHEVVAFRQAKQIAKLLINSFLRQHIHEVYLIFPNFISALKQEPTLVKLLPISPVTLNDKNRHTEDASGEFLFEPNADALLEYILLHQVETTVYQALLETKASEHSARMMAMQNATDNAQELVSDLNLSYNQTRQEGITRELLEITSAAAALE